MSITRRLRFIHAQISWMLCALLALALLNSVSYELFFVVSLIGLLVIIELTAPFRITPKWRKRLWIIILIGLVGFSYILIRRVLAILPPGVI
jgi:hypothetical protein